jgi:hypothetical protein
LRAVLSDATVYLKESSEYAPAGKGSKQANLRKIYLPDTGKGKGYQFAAIGLQ